MQEIKSRVEATGLETKLYRSVQDGDYLKLLRSKAGWHTSLAGTVSVMGQICPRFPHDITLVLFLVEAVPARPVKPTHLGSSTPHSESNLY